MPAHRWRAAWMSLALALAVLAGALGAAIHTAHAKSLGGVTSKSLYGKKATLTPITDNFNDTGNPYLNTTKDVYGDTWQVQPGSYRITSGTDGYVVSTVTTASEATVPGTVNAAVGIDLSSLTTASTGCGVLLNAAGGGSYVATTLVYDRNAKTLMLERLNATGAIVWSVGPRSITLSTTYLFLTYSAGVYTAYQDGTKIWTQSLTAPQQAEVEGYSRVGFGSASGTTCQFDNFQDYPL